MVSLLDVNVLVALFDPSHVHHETAHDWLGRHRGAGWATCPLTENGLVRVLSYPSYPGRRTTVADAIDRLDTFTRSESHEFWEDSVSLRERALIDPAHIGGARQVSDVYLLALAMSRRARLATFDRRLNPAAVEGAAERNLALLGTKR